MISFLYPYPSKRGECGNSIKDLHVERIVRHFYVDDVKQRYIIDILSSFENNLNNIYYRQELFRDLFKYPKFFEGLNIAYNQLFKIYEEYQTLKRQYANIKNIYEPSKTLLEELIKDFCYLLKKLMNVYQDLESLMDKYPFASEALINFQSFINEKVENSAFDELYKLFDELILYSSSYELAITLDNDLKVYNSALLLSKGSRGNVKRHKELMVPLNINSQPFYSNVYNDAQLNLFRLLDELYYGLMMPLFNLKDELIFCDFALKLYELAKRLKMEICFPTFVNEGMEYDNLYDLFLGIKGLEEMYQVIDVYPNSIKINAHDTGRFIIGNNNTGKTVFIRSVGISQILAQAGLFVTAKEAKLNVKNRILTFLSSKEISTTTGGRFEKEVSVISKIIDEVDQNALIIMNEIFQSTSYEAGVDALYNILVYLTKKNTLWLAVTHLKDIINKRLEFNQETKKDFKVLSTSIEGYRFLITEMPLDSQNN